VQIAAVLRFRLTQKNINHSKIEKGVQNEQQKLYKTRQNKISLHIAAAVNTKNIARWTVGAR
jgi:hypothetical protein